MSLNNVERLKHAITGTVPPAFDLSCSGITATNLSDGTTWTADLLKPDLQISYDQLTKGTKTIVLGANDAHSRLQLTFGMDKVLPPPPSTSDHFVSRDEPNGWYAVLGMAQLGQVISAALQGPETNQTAVPILLTGNITYQYHVLKASPDQRRALLEALSSAGLRDEVFYDLYPTNVSAVVIPSGNGRREGNGTAAVKPFTVPHALTNKVPSPELLRLGGIPLMQALACIPSAEESYNGWLDITDTYKNLLQQGGANARPQGGVNITLNGGDLATIIGVAGAIFGVSRAKSHGPSVRTLGGFNISVGLSISI